VLSSEPVRSDRSAPVVEMNIDDWNHSDDDDDDGMIMMMLIMLVFMIMVVMTMMMIIKNYDNYD